MNISLHYLLTLTLRACNLCGGFSKRFSSHVTNPGMIVDPPNFAILTKPATHISFAEDHKFESIICARVWPVRLI